MSAAQHTASPCRLLAGWIVSALFFTSSLTASESNCPIQLRDVTRETGINFVHTDGSSGRRYIVETVSSGLATFDFNGDGKIDIVFLNGAPCRARQPRHPHREMPCTGTTAVGSSLT